MLGRILTNMMTLGAAEVPWDARAFRDPWEENVTSNAGVVVTREAALSYSPWFRAIDLLGDSVGRASASVYRTTDDKGSRDADRKHPWFRAVNMKAGPNWTAFQFYKLMTGWYRTVGNAYAYIDRDYYELLPISPDRMTPVLEREEGSNTSKLWYVLDGKRKYDPAEILHIKGFGFDGLIGYSVIDKAREALGLALGARQHQTSILKNAGRPGLILTTPQKLGKALRDELATEWRKMHSGGSNAGRTAVLDGGMEAKPYVFTSEDMQLMESQKFSIRDVSNFTGVPAVKLGLKDGGGYNSVEHDSISFLSDTLEAIFTNFEQEMHDKLLTEDEKASDSHAVGFDRSMLSAVDLNTKAQAYRTLVGGAPIATQAEARRAFPNMGFIEGTDELQQPANMQKGGPGGVDNNPADPTGPPPGKAPASPAPAAPPADAMKAAASAVLREAIARLARRLVNQARAKSGKPDGFAAWAARLEAESRAAVAEEFAAVEELASLAHGVRMHGRGVHLLGYIAKAFRDHGPAAIDRIAGEAETLANVGAVQKRETNGQFGAGDGRSENVKQAVDKANETAKAGSEAAVAGLLKAPGFNGPQNAAEVSAKLSEVYAKTELTINIPPARGAEIASTGSYQNMLEAGTNDKGHGYDKTRMRQERTVLGVPDDAAPGDRPHYGALNFGRNMVGGATEYGHVAIVMNKDAVGNRVTYTSGNSFDHRDGSAVGTHDNPLNAIANNNRAVRAAGYTVDNAGPGSPRSDGYVEAQIHGPVRIDSATVSEIRIHTKDAHWNGTRALVDHADTQGIPVRFYGPDGRDVPREQAYGAPREQPNNAGRGWFGRLFGRK